MNKSSRGSVKDNDFPIDAIITTTVAERGARLNDSGGGRR